MSLFGIGNNDAAAYSIVFWSFQAMVLMASGIFGAFYIMLSRRDARRLSEKQ